MASGPDAAPEGRFAAFSIGGFRAYWMANTLSGFALQIQTVAVGWYVYDLTRNPLDLGLVGLSQFLPALLLVFVTGSVADRFARRTIMAVCLGLMALTALMLLGVTALGVQGAAPVFVILALFGVARAFYNPARQSIVSNLVPRSQLANAIAAVATAQQFATICGPVAGGFLYAVSAETAYGAAMALMGVSALLVIGGMPRQGRPAGAASADGQALGAGFRYIWTNKPLLGAVSLDLFAVLLGGAMALLPVYARDILDVGPEGLGLLRAGPAMGAILVGGWLMMRPIRDHAGLFMFVSVAGFGLATTVFAFSEMLWLSFAMLALAGAFDMVSVHIRAVLVQLWAPDEVRGRVTAVNQVFIGASNEMGAFRAGVMAVWIGPVAAVAVGGAAILLIAGAWARLFPELRRVRHLR